VAAADAVVVDVEETFAVMDAAVELVLVAMLEAVDTDVKAPFCLYTQ
jgi:hypothetical protein